MMFDFSKISEMMEGAKRIEAEFVAIKTELQTNNQLLRDLIAKIDRQTELLEWTKTNSLKAA